MPNYGGGNEDNGNLLQKFPCMHCYTQSVPYWESQFLGRLTRSPGSPRREGSEALKVEIGVWNSQGGEKDKRFYIPLHSFSSVTQSCPTLCDPMNRSTPRLPVHHQLLEFTQTHVHRVGDAIQPSHPLSSPSPPAPNPSQHQRLFQWVNSSHEVAKVLEFQLQHQSFQWTPRTDLL